MSLTPSPQHEVDARRRLAFAVVETLTAAGLPGHVGTADRLHVPGAEVEVDPFDDGGGGVFVHWVASQELADRGIAALESGEFDHPAIQLKGAIAGAMAEAMSTLLTASGFRIEVSDDDYRPFALEVFAASD
ncbi:hypothetical protein [Pedococcus dokdonensis]|nr:hypothetical protein [Pedococcus dokdonensis]